MNKEDLQYLNAQPDGRTVLTTSRLEIRELVRKNASSVLHIISECPENAFMLPSLDLPGSGHGNSDDRPTGCQDSDELKTGALIAGDITDQYRFFGYGLWGVFYLGANIGLAMLKNGSESGTAEIGYAILKEYRRCGFMTEAMLAVLEYARGQGFLKAEIQASGENLVSQAFFDNLVKKYYTLYPDRPETTGRTTDQTSDHPADHATDRTADHTTVVDSFSFTL
ncbi:MAG: GNAT family N-acetyltransferase [Lachnospiraceae bacterium]|nr:GNAT family N-acetyltransferase [Lachnospiraceae bacterium]